MAAEDVLVVSAPKAPVYRWLLLLFLPVYRRLVSVAIAQANVLEVALSLPSPPPWPVVPLHSEEVLYVVLLKKKVV